MRVSNEPSCCVPGYQVGQFHALLFQARCRAQVAVFLQGQYMGGILDQQLKAHSLSLCKAQGWGQFLLQTCLILPALTDRG